MSGKTPSTVAISLVRRTKRRVLEISSRLQIEKWECISLMRESVLAHLAQTTRSRKHMRKVLQKFTKS